MRRPTTELPSFRPSPSRPALHSNPQNVNCQNLETTVRSNPNPIRSHHPDHLLPLTTSFPLRPPSPYDLLSEAAVNKDVNVSFLVLWFSLATWGCVAMRFNGFEGKIWNGTEPPQFLPSDCIGPTPSYHEYYSKAHFHRHMSTMEHP